MIAQSIEERKNISHNPKKHELKTVTQKGQGNG